MVITRCDVRHQRAENIERCLVALLHLFFHVELDLIHRHVAWTLNHHLNVFLPGTTRQFTKGVELGKLSRIGSIVLTARAQRITQ
ncbi:MAG: Uncharacterised protein [Cyanobium sp. ARS6]|nr:MAG: Uncharacterised protein [Cyanobium sp. ARS6]